MITRDDVHTRLADGVGTLTAAEVGVLIGSNASTEREAGRMAMAAARRGEIPPPVTGLQGRTRGWMWSIALIKRWLDGQWRPATDELAERRAS